MKLQRAKPALLWLWMVLVNWKKHKVTIETVAGTKEY